METQVIFAIYLKTVYLHVRNVTSIEVKCKWITYVYSCYWLNMIM